jgi:DNA ligase (NAD+)
LGHYYEDDLVIPKVCPICGQPTAINESEQLYCTNPDCDGKWLNKIEHFCGKKGLDIKGISKATLEKLIDKGWINSFADIFHLKEHEEEWKQLPSFGVKSVDRILNSIEAAKSTNFESFIAAIGIPLVGKTVAKELIKNGITTYEDLKEKAADNFDFSKFNGFGPEKTAAICGFDFSMADEVFTELTFTSVELPKTNNNNSFSVVITGRLEKFKNRDELKSLIERNGGKVVTAISSKVDCLINNNINSTSSKNVSAKRLNIPIYSEEEFLRKYIKIS